MKTFNFVHRLRKNITHYNKKTVSLRKLIHDTEECIIDVGGCLDGKITIATIRDESCNNSGSKAVCIL